jgi:formamidopyrimidine-DNA glycosylase
MPELPEVETLCRQLRQVIIGRQIVGFEVIDPKIGTFSGIIGRWITAVNRYGKGLEIVLDSGMALRLHLRMSGKLLWQTSYHLLIPHTRFILGFEAGRLLCIDPRRFATLSLQGISLPNRLPLYPLQKTDLPRIRAHAEKRRITVKAFLLDQTVIAGIGNIYACEILHEAAIDPESRACDLSLEQWQHIADATMPILKKAISARGTTVSDWHDLFGQKGENQRHLKVYARASKPCPRCGASVVRKRISGRGTYYCPSCQK